MEVDWLLTELVDIAALDEVSIMQSHYLEPGYTVTLVWVPQTQTTTALQPHMFMYQVFTESYIALRCQWPLNVLLGWRDLQAGASVT